jgi:3-oxoacyl-[acyl-carrier protein] reductase
MDAEELKSMAKAIPAGHVGTTDDAAGAALYLLSEEAAYVTGANIHVSGGWGI